MPSTKELHEAFNISPRPEKLPCPFCKSQRTRTAIISGDTGYFVTCDDCSAEGPHIPDADRRDAIEAWNHRP